MTPEKLQNYGKKFPGLSQEKAIAIELYLDRLKFFQSVMSASIFDEQVDVFKAALSEADAFMKLESLFPDRKELVRAIAAGFEIG